MATGKPSSAGKSWVGPPPTGRSSARAKLGAVGRPHAGIEVRVVDEELQVRSQKSAPADAATLGDRITDDGWLRTGDLARIDDDGFVWIDGRVERDGEPRRPEGLSRRSGRAPARVSGRRRRGGCRSPRRPARRGAVGVRRGRRGNDRRCRRVTRVVPAAAGRLQDPRRRDRARRAAAQRDRQAPPPGPRALAEADDAGGR